MSDLTREDFARAYAERSGVTVEWLKRRGREARPCDCDSEDCEGWQMAHMSDYQEEAPSVIPATGKEA